MYKQFFGLSENPFNVNPDPRYLYLTARTRGALNELAYGIEARQGLMLLSGEVGTGKTTLLNRLLDWLHRQKTPTAFIFNPNLEIGHLFDLILAEFEVPADRRFPGNALMRLNHWLIERYRAGDNPVLIVDEAQGLSRNLLEEIRMLLNLETPHEKLLQIVLSGQPELEERLKQNDLRQLKQRITLHCRTGALTIEETHDYIQARLHVAGANGTPIFSSQAMDAVHFYSRGIPRVTNLLCEHALINAFADRIQPVPAHIIEDIAREFQLDKINSFAPSFDSEGGRVSARIAPQSAIEPEIAPPRMETEPPSRDMPGVTASAVPVPNAVTSSLLIQPKEVATQVLNYAPPLPPAEIIIVVPIPSVGAASEHERIAAREPFDSVSFNSGAAIEPCTKMTVEEIPSFPIALVEPVKKKHKVDLSPISSRRPSGDTRKAAPRPAGTIATKLTPVRSGQMGLRRTDPSPAKYSVRWKKQFLSAVGSPFWKQEVTTTFLRLKRSLPSVGAPGRRLSAPRPRGQAISSSGANRLRRMATGLYNWLRQPFDPVKLWRVPYSWLCARRPAAHKMHNEQYQAHDQSEVYNGGSYVKREKSQ